jgi:hypothetical protein
MAEVTLSAIEQLLDLKLEPINIKLTAIEEIVSGHTATLDALARDVKVLRDEKAISVTRFERLEHWAHQVGEKLGIKLEV